jgi:hypothetical protein
MISLGGLVSEKAFGKFEMGKVISNPFATAFVNEAEGEDHEVSMGQNQLDTIIKMATELKSKMGEDEKEIPAWIQDHIAKAESYISQATNNYHEYGTNESTINENTNRANILGIDFDISETNGKILFSFKDKKAASIAVRKIGTNKIVNHIQKSLDNAYGKGEFFFRGGSHAEFQNGYLFQRTIGNINLNKLKFETVNEASYTNYNLGKVQYTDKNMTPVQILDLAMAYVQTPITKVVGNKHEFRIRAANDLAKLTGTTQSDVKVRGKQPALILFLLKNKLVSKEEYTKLYKDLLAKQIEVIKYLKNSSPEMRGSAGAARAAAKDMKGEFDENIREAKKYDIGAGYMGNGLTIWNRAEEQHGDYKIIAHIDNYGKISIRDKQIPSNVMKMIEDWASAMKKGDK